MAESTAAGAAGAGGAGGPWEWLTSLWTTQEWNMDVIALLYSRYTGYLVVFVLVDFFMLFCVPEQYVFGLYALSLMLVLQPFVLPSWGLFLTLSILMLTYVDRESRRRSDLVRRHVGGLHSMLWLALLQAGVGGLLYYKASLSTAADTWEVQVAGLLAVFASTRVVDSLKLRAADIERADTMRAAQEAANQLNQSTDASGGTTNSNSMYRTANSTNDSSNSNNSSNNNNNVQQRAADNKKRKKARRRKH